jgi:hypothetical protein
MDAHQTLTETLFQDDFIPILFNMLENSQSLLEKYIGKKV